MMNTSKNKDNKQKVKMYVKLRRYFLAGLVAILPLWLTLYILWLLFKLVGNITRPFLGPILGLFFEREPVVFLVRISSFILTLLIVMFAGMIATDIAGRKLLLSLENMLTRIPLLRDIYLFVRKLTQYVFTKKQQYRQVALLEWPLKGVMSMGFITSEFVSSDNRKMVTLFIPTTPNPTTGWFFIVPEEKIIPLDLNADDAMKMIITGGMAGTDNYNWFPVKQGRIKP